MKNFLFLPLLILLVLGLNYKQLYSMWAVQQEMKRLDNVAQKLSDEFQNPSPVQDDFTESVSSKFWKFTIINGSGKVSNENQWHSASIAVDNDLTISHFSDPDFENENADVMHQPAAGRYNNVSLIGGSGFRPTPNSDIVLKFSSRTSNWFYGTAGVIFQPEGTLQKDGIFTKPFDMFGFSVAGKESTVKGVNGPFCYLALNWIPVEVKPLPVDTASFHNYEIRLQWIDKTRWLGILKVDDKKQCQMQIPAFGTVEVHVWSDNSLVADQPRRWWEIGPTMDLKFQDGGEKEFHLDRIQIFEELR